MSDSQAQTQEAINILYIEDDAGLARLAQRRLERSGKLSVTTAASAEEGLQLIDRQTPDAVIIDYVLPDMNGLAVLKIIEDKYPAVVSIMVTGAGDESTAVYAMKHHAKDYIIKDANGEYLELLPKQIQGLVAHQRLLARQLESDKAIRYLSAAVSQSGDAIIIFDHDGTASYANETVEKISGYSAGQLIGKNPIRPGDRQWPLKHAVWRKVTSTQAIEHKIVEQHKNGNLFPAMVTISPIMDGDGNIERYLASMKDMTEYDTLLAEFNQAQKMETIGTLVGGIAHDFNNSLAAITGNLYLLKKRTANIPEAAKKITSIEELCFQLRDMIKQLLTFARKSITDMNPLSVSSLLSKLINIQKAAIPENIALRHDIRESDMQIRGDFNLLQQVVMNIVNNAKDAVEDSSKPSISISLNRFSADEDFQKRHPELANDDYACIKIADNGCGIEESDIEHVFEPFFTSKAVGKGTGLGLAMSYGAIQSHNGTIEVGSTLGKGSEFRIYLPLIELVETNEPKDQRQDVAKGSGETILLVDDHQKMIETGRAVLKSLGYKVLIAYDGEEAIEMYQTHRQDIDLCILDVIMPNMGGVDAAQAILELNPDVKIIFSTGYDRGSTLRKTDKIENAMVLSKPFTIRELSHTIRHCFDN